MKGATLLELIITLSIITVGLTLAWPRARAGLDALAVRSGREMTVAALARARMLAIGRGGAEVVINANADRIAVLVGGANALDPVVLGELGVDVMLVPAETTAVIRYDAHGIGRMASRTVRLQRRTAVAGVTVSSYGRVRRW